MNKLTTLTLGEIRDQVDGVIKCGPFGSQLHQSDYIDDPNGTPVIMPKDLKEGKVSVATIARIAENDVCRLQQHQLEEGDIVYSRRGDLSRRALIGVREIGWLCGTGCIRISLGTEVLNPTFFFYYLGNPKTAAWVQNQATGATMPNLNTGIIRSIKISAPDLVSQRKIASILSAYDDLIENNTRRIKILEQMAQTIYREWFVKFRFPGHEKVKMVDSPLGKIPEGWEVKRLGDISLNFDRKRKPMSKMQRAKIQGEYPYYGAAKVLDFVNDYIFDGVYLLMAEDGSVITPERKPVLQYVSGKFWANNHTHILQGTGCVSTEFLHIVLSNVDIAGYITGAAQPKINQENLNRIPIVVATDSVMEKFDNIVTDVFRLRINFEIKNANLRQTRDLLLPKLISGEIDVSEMDIEVGGGD